MVITNNKDYGFYGTARTIDGTTFANIAWKAAVEYIISFTEWPETKARDFLDSKYGRHYADSLGGLPVSENFEENIDAMRLILTEHPWVQGEALCFEKHYDPEEFD